MVHLLLVRQVQPWPPLLFLQHRGAGVAAHTVSSSRTSKTGSQSSLTIGINSFLPHTQMTQADLYSQRSKRDI